MEIRSPVNDLLGNRAEKYPGFTPGSCGFQSLRQYITGGKSPIGSNPTSIPSTPVRESRLMYKWRDPTPEEVAGRRSSERARPSG